MARLRIHSITCENTQEGIDEIYVEVVLSRGAGIRIHDPTYSSITVMNTKNMDDGGSVAINWPTPAEEREGLNYFFNFAVVNVWEEDVPRRNRATDDRIGALTIEQFPEVRQRVVSGKGGRYRISYSVLEDFGGSGWEWHRTITQWPIQLGRIHCLDAKGVRDDVYLLWNGQRIWGPTRMRTGDTRSIDRRIVIYDQGTLSLWEKDRRNSDHLGTHVLRAERLAVDAATHGTGERSLRFEWYKSSTRDSAYTLYYES